MGHPSKPDSWSKVQYIPPGAQPSDDEPTGATVVWVVIAGFVGTLSFTLGYMSGLWGWF